MDGAMDGYVETPEKRKLEAPHVRQAVAKFGKLGPRCLLDLDPEPEKQKHEVVHIRSESEQQEQEHGEIISSEPTQEVEQTSLVTTSPIEESEPEVEQEQDQDQEQKLGLMEVVSSEEQEEQDLESERPMVLVDSTSMPALPEQEPGLNDLHCEHNAACFFYMPHNMRTAIGANAGETKLNKYMLVCAWSRQSK